MLRLGVLCVFVLICMYFLCTGYFVMVPLKLTYLHCLQHSSFEHLFNLYCQTAMLRLRKYVSAQRGRQEICVIYRICPYFRNKKSLFEVEDTILFLNVKKIIHATIDLRRSINNLVYHLQLLLPRGRTHLCLVDL